MKPTNIVFILSMAGVFFLTQCKKEKDFMANAHFYTTDTSTSRAVFLYIDEVAYGRLPIHPIVPDCSHLKMDSITLSFALKSGKYHFEMKNAVGTVLSSSIFSFGENRTQGGGNIGTMEASLSNDHCLRIGLGSLEE
jgi:hypothetical protein